jgi:hypothetical protein
MDLSAAQICAIADRLRDQKVPRAATVQLRMGDDGRFNVTVYARETHTIEPKITILDGPNAAWLSKEVATV